MSWIHTSSMQTRSFRSSSLTTSEKIRTTVQTSAISSHSSSLSTSTASIDSSSSEKPSAAVQALASQKLYLLLPNHKCPNKKTCPFHPPEEEEEELDEAEVTLINKRRAMSLASHEDRMISEQLLADKLAKINQQISSNLLEGNKLHLPRKTSHDITLPTADLDRLRSEHCNSEAYPAASSTREESVASDYDLDSGVTFDSFSSDRELDEDSLPLIQEEVVVPDIVLPAELKLRTEEQQQPPAEIEAAIDINEVSNVDSGTYLYQMVSSPEEAESSATVTIEEHILESHTKPHFIKELEYLTVTEGSLVKLECAVIGDPTPNIKWLKNNHKVESNDIYKLHNYEDGTATLSIERAEQEDSGTYTCVAENVAGCATTQSKIRVQKAIEEVQIYQRPENKEVKKHHLVVPPEFTAKLKSKTALEGTTVILNCSVTGIPEPTHRWVKDGKEIFDNTDFTQRKNGGLLSLEIAYVKQSLAGEYVVEASNSEGTISCSCILQVEGEREIETVELDIQRPKFLTKIQDVYVREGENATFLCTAAGKPAPAFKWLRDMISITESDSVEMDSDNQGHAHLTLKKVKRSDSGLYYCVAQSKSGRAKCSAYLHITAKSTSPVHIKKDEEYVKVQYSSKEGSVEKRDMLGEPPSLVLMLPDTLDVVVGGRLKLDCSVQGYPMPLVTWHKGDRGLMYSQRHRIIPCGTLHQMEIPQVMALDKGEYIVRATNIYGTVQTSCYVNILPKGSKVEAPGYNREGVVIVAKQNLQAPFFVKHLPKSIDAIIGMHVRLDCILREGIELIQWPKDISSFQELDKDKKEFADEGFHGEFIPLMTISHDKPSSQSEEKKQSEGVINKSSSQKENRIELLSFATTLKDIVQLAGSEAVFECSTTGVVECEVKWYKEDKLLTANSRVKMTTVGNKQILSITDICNSDEGEYKCKLDQPAGTKSCGAVLKVIEDAPEKRPTKTQSTEREQKQLADKATEEQLVRQEKPDKYEKPSFKQTLPKTTIANHGDNIELVCELTSTDMDSVKWELDGRELPTEARYSVSSDESKSEHKLTIQAVTDKDSAKYTCVVCLKDGDLIYTSTKLNVSAEKPEPVQKEKDLTPNFTTKLKDTVVKDGEGLVLECDIEGNPRPQILWFRDYMEIFDSPDFQISTIGCHCKLQISEIYPEDEGNYSCKAVNNLGEAISSCYVTVEEKSKTRRGDKREATGEAKKSNKKDQDKPELPPELVVKPRRQFIDDGGKAKFKASFDGSKNTVLFWSKDGQVLKEGDNFQMYEADGFHFLEVKKVSVENSGMYSVTVQNVAGSDTAEAELEVFEKPKLLSKSGPEWEQTLQDLTVEEDDTDVALICTCKELIQPSVRWFHNGKEVFSGFHMKIQHVAQTSTLTIKAIQERDAGEFKCIMAGKNGELETSCILTIGSPGKMEPPIFVKELHDMEVEEGDKLELNVEVKGMSSVRVCWYHNNVEIVHGSPQHLISSQGHVHTLTLLEATSKSSGEYVCEAYNDGGSTDTYCFVDVKEVKHPEPPSFVVHPLNLSAHEGETATFTCQVKGQPMPSVHWKKGGVTIATSEKFKATRIHDCHTLTVYNVTCTDGGEFVCYVHSTQGAVSHVCRLDVTTDQQFPWQPQGTGLLKSRPSQIEHVQQMSHFEYGSVVSGEHPLSSPQNFREFRTRGISHLPDDSRNDEVQTTTASDRTSMESSIRASTTAQHPMSYNVDIENLQDNLHNSQRNNIESINPHKKTVTDTTEKINLHSSILFNSPDNLQTVQNKDPHEMKETRIKKNLGVTDFRSVLKHSEMAPVFQPGKSTTQSQNMDFKKVLLQNQELEPKGNKFEFETFHGGTLSSELNNVTVTQTSKIIPPNSTRFRSESVPAPPSWSSPIYSPTYENGGHAFKDFTHMKKESTVNDLKSTSVQHTFGDSRKADALSASSLEPSRNVKQNWRGMISTTSASEHCEKVSGIQVGDTTSTGRLGRSNFVAKRADPLNVENNNLSGSLSITDSFSAGTGSDSVNMEQEVLESLNRINHQSLRNGIEVDTQFHSQTGSNFSPDQHLRGNANNLQVAFQSLRESDSCQVKENSISSLQSQKLKPQPQKVSLTQLSACKVSISEFNPSTPQSEAVKLEVTSVSASVPLRQSLTSTYLHPKPKFMTNSDLSIAYNSDIKLEDNDVFTEASTERNSSIFELQRNSRSDDKDNNLQPFGSTSVYEKTTGNKTDNKKSILSKSSHQGSYHQSSDITDSQIKRGRTRFSEYLPSYKEHDHQGDERFTGIFSPASRNRTSSCLDNLAQVSPVDVTVTDNIVDDFRNVKLKPAAPSNSKQSDLARSKFMSKSTESIFTDVKLKPVSQTNDSYKKSEISSNAERIRSSSKSSDFSKNFPTSSSASYLRKIPTSKTTVNALSTTPKFSDCVKTFGGDSKPKNFLQNSRYQKSVQSSKLRTSGKYERPVTGGVSRSNSYKKSKGIGAKFEAAIKDLKTSDGQVPYTSLNVSRNNQGDIKTSRQQNFALYNTGKNLVNLQNAKLPETAPSQNILKKSVNTVNKPNSYNTLGISNSSKTFVQSDSTKTVSKPDFNNTILNSDSENYLNNVTDWVKKRQSLQIDNPTNSTKFASNAFGGKERLSATDASWKLEEDKLKLELDSFNKTNRPSFLRNYKDEQVKADQPNRKFSQDTEERIRTRSRRNEESINRPQLSPKQFSTESSKFELKIGDKTEHADLEAAINSRETLKMSTDVDLDRKSFIESNSTAKTFPVLLSEQSRLCNNETIRHMSASVSGFASVTPKSVNDDVGKFEIYKSEVTITPDIESKVPFPSTVFSKPVVKPTISTVLQSTGTANVNSPSTTVNTRNNTELVTDITPGISLSFASTSTEKQMLTTPFNEPLESGLKEHQFEGPVISNVSPVSSGEQNGKSNVPSVGRSFLNESPPGNNSLESHSENEHLQNTRSSWTKQRSHRHIPVYPISDTELSPNHGSMKLTNDDLESVLSMTSSSSDASNVTVDSGYTRNYLRTHLGNENKYVDSDTIYPENSETWNQIPSSGGRNISDENQIRGISYIKTASESKITDDSFGHNENTDNNMGLTTNLKYIQRRSRRFKEGTDEILAKAVALQDVQEQRKPDINYLITNDRIRNVDLKQTRNQGDNLSAGQTLNLKESESSYGINDLKFSDFTNDSSVSTYISRRQRRDLDKNITVSCDNNALPETRDSYVNPPTEIILSRTGSKDSNKIFAKNDIKSNSAISESPLRIQPEKLRSKFDIENIKHESDKDRNIVRGLGSEPQQVHQEVPTPRSTSLLITSTSSIVLAPKTSALSKTSEIEKEKHFCPPSFPVPLHDTSVPYGSMTVLQCQITGNPTPDVKWLLNQKQIEPSESVEITYNDITAKLTIKNVSGEYVGDYTCWARNTLGTVSTHCTVSLDGTDINSVGTEPVIKTDADKMFPCLSKSPGEANVEQVTSNMCVDGVPDAPLGKPQVCVKDKNSAYVSWSGPSGGTGILVTYYVVEAKRGAETFWDVVIPESKEQTCHIQGLMSTATYQFRVLAANGHGVSPPSEPSNPVIICDPSILTSDYDVEIPVKHREVVINTSDKFEDLYEVDKEVGRGKFGVVYKCKCKKDGIIWAAKVVKCRQKEKVELKREIDVMNKLHHPKLLLLWDAFETPRQMVLVMEYIGAGELFERVIADDFVLTENDCIHFMQQICEGVDYIHSSSIIHLDLKPENILCISENSNRIKIIDFGLAQFYKPGQSKKVLFGTPEFIAPEVINYDEISFVTDMWSIGVICYVLLSGLSPFLGDSETETLANVTQAEFDFDDEAFEEITDLAKDFICQLLVKKKEKRLLTGQCLAHPWLNQDEVDGSLNKRLSTERLKKFMIRQKWLKTGNAVKAVGRLLKSNSLSGFGSFDRSFSSDSGQGTPSVTTTLPFSVLQRTVENIDDEDQTEPNIEEDFEIQDTFSSLGHIPKHSVDGSFISQEEKLASARNRSSSKGDAPSTSTFKNTLGTETQINSPDKNTASLLSGITSGEQVELTSNRDKINNMVISGSSIILAAKVTDLNQGAEKSSSSSLPAVSRHSDKSSSSLPAVSRHSDNLQAFSTPEHKSSPQINNRKTEISHVPRTSDDKTSSEAPCFTKLMSRCKTVTGDVARFDVAVSGNPVPKVMWFLEDEEIHTDSRHTLSSNDNTKAFSLIIRNVEEEDEGDYICKAVNSQGECVCGARLDVLSL